MKNLKTRSLIWILIKRFFKRTFRILLGILKAIFGLYRNCFKRSKREFTVLIIITLIIAGMIFWAFRSGKIQLTRAVEIPKAEAKQTITEIKSQNIDTTNWAIRIDNYLVAKHSPLAGKGNIFVLAGLQYKVSPELLVSICGADTSFGKNCCWNTPFNVGNVGNDDAGNRVNFQSYDEGIVAVAKVLNNQYLGNKQTLGSLSYGGGGTGKIYASSLYNWNKNVKQFTSEQLGTRIDEGFSFRIK